MNLVPKSLAAMLLFMAAATGSPLVRSAELAPPSIDPSRWPRMTSTQFGCYMEKTFGHRDRRFNCATKNYRNDGDPCDNTEPYYEGPAFPDRAARKVHPLATHVELDWEHEELRDVTVTLKGTWNEAQVRKVFRMPRTESFRLSDAENAALPEHLMSTSVHYPLSNDDAVGTRASDPTRGTTSVSFTGFEHMGAADFECGEPG